MDTNWTEEFWDMDYLKRKMVNKSGSAPCKAACPAHISIQGYIRKAAEGKYDEALKVIKRDNPFPAVCGRICPHDCENECTRARVDEAMAIDDIKKFIAEKEQEYNDKFSNPYNAARYGYIDDVIEPRNTRFRIIRALQSLATKRLQNPAKKHSNIPL